MSRRPGSNKRLLALVPVIVLNVTLNIALAITVNFLTDEPAGEWLNLFVQHPVLMLGTLAASLVALGMLDLFRTSAGAAADSDLPPIQLSDATGRTREAVLRGGREYWVAGYLRSTVSSSNEYQLEVDFAPRYVAAPDNPQRPPSPRPATQPCGILAALSASGCSVLVLAPPGAGKTIALLQLMRELAATAERNHSAQVPLYCRLADWSGESLEKWLQAELIENYPLSRREAAALVNSSQLIPILDGLDEVDEAQRAACVEEINRYLDTFSRSAIVAARFQAYIDLDTRLRLHSAVLLRPLPPQLVRRRVGRLHARSRTAVAVADPPIEALFRTPLWLALLESTNSAPELVSDRTVSEQSELDRLWSRYLRLKLPPADSERDTDVDGPTEPIPVAESPVPWRPPSARERLDHADLRRGLAWVALAIRSNRTLFPDLIGPDELDGRAFRWLPRRGVAAAAGLSSSGVVALFLYLMSRSNGPTVFEVVSVLATAAIVAAVSYVVVTDWAPTLAVGRLRIAPRRIPWALGVSATFAAGTYAFSSVGGGTAWSDIRLPLFTLILAMPIAGLSCMSVQHRDELHRPGSVRRLLARNVWTTIAVVALFGGVLATGISSALSILFGVVRPISYDALGTIMLWMAVITSLILLGRGFVLLYQGLIRGRGTGQGSISQWFVIGIAGVAVGVGTDRVMSWLLSDAHWTWQYLTVGGVATALLVLGLLPARFGAPWCVRAAAVVLLSVSLALLVPLVMSIRTLPPSTSLSIALILVLGLHAVLASGGAHLLCHSLTTVLLARRSLPVPLDDLLLELEARALVIRVGAGYQMIHPSFLEYLRRQRSDALGG